jgi:hypothetical protein
VSTLKALARQVAAGAGGAAPVAAGGSGDASGPAGQNCTAGGGAGAGGTTARELLASMLRQAGYAKLGQRKAVEAALLEED